MAFLVGHSVLKFLYRRILNKSHAEHVDKSMHPQAIVSTWMMTIWRWRWRKWIGQQKRLYFPHPLTKKNSLLGATGKESRQIRKENFLLHIIKLLVTTSMEETPSMMRKTLRGDFGALDMYSTEFMML